MFKTKYATLEEVPAEVRHLFVKTDNGYEIIGAGQIKTVQDVERVQEGARKEREEHKATKEKLKAFGDLDPEETLQKLDKIEEYELAAKGKLNEEEINAVVEARIKTKVAPLERQITQLTQEKTTLEASVATYETKDKTRRIHDAIRTAGVSAKVRDTAIEDAFALGERVFEIDDLGNVVTKDGVGVTPGIDASVWLTELKDKKPHWWESSQGAGAMGGNGSYGGTNPFSAENWNMTEQSKLVNTDRNKAEQLAKSAGTTIGGPKPEK